MKILICGDSFSADWQAKYPDSKGWVNLLSDKYSVVNLAQCGVSEYKIWKQIQNVDLNNYDSIIISHATPNRIHCDRHPIHSDSILHKNSDLIYADLLSHKDNVDVRIAINYFERYFELEYYKDISDLICMQILNILGEYSHLNQFHITNYTNNVKYKFLPSYNINKIFTQHRGEMNHLSDKGNQLVFNVIDKWIKSIVK